MSKLHFKKWPDALHLAKRVCYSQRQKDESKNIYLGRVSQIIKEKSISHLNLYLVVLHDSSLSLSAAHFFIVCATDRRKLLFKANGIGSLTVQ